MRLTRRIVIFFILSVSAAVMLFPFAWMVSTSFKSGTETIRVPLRLLPGPKTFIRTTGTQVEVLEKKDGMVRVRVLFGLERGKEKILPWNRIVKRTLLFDNYRQAWNAAPFGIYFLNSLLVAVCVTGGQLVTSALAAYAFAKLRFPYKKFLFNLFLATLMIPGQVLIVPNYVMLARLGMINTYFALILPFLASAFSIYYMSQHFGAIPQDLFDAARIDGCSQLQVLRLIVLPLSVPVVLSTGIFVFTGNWNSLFWPLIVTNSTGLRTLQVGLAVFNQEASNWWHLLMAASTFTLVPLVLLFLLAQKTFIEGISSTGLKE
jgi:ABC-type glycerol-3-phosphate transport system permease component